MEQQSALVRLDDAWERIGQIDTRPFISEWPFPSQSKSPLVQ